LNQLCLFYNDITPIIPLIFDRIFKLISDASTYIMKEIDAVVQVIYRKCNIIYSKQIIDQNDEGLVGELFCKYGVKQVFFDKGYYAIRGSNKTFTIEEQINANRTSRTGGIDFYSKFKINSKEYKLYIEMKNQKYYPKGITPSSYNDDILDRFTKNDPNRNRYWILAINYRNIKSIQSRCLSDNINVVPIDDKIIPSNINPKTLKPIFSSFVYYFSILVDDIISGKVKP